MALALLWLCALLAFVRSATHLATVGQPVHLDGFRPLRALAGRARVPMVLFLVGSLLQGVWPQQPVAGLALVFIALVALARQEARDWDSGVVAELGQYGPTAAALLGFLVTYTMALLHVPEAALEAGWQGACGVVGGAYFLAGVSKVREAGLRWLHPSHLALILLERSHRGAPWQRALRRRLANTPVLCAAGAGLALAIELAGPAFWVPEFRMPYAVAAGAMQVGFALILGFWELEWILLLPALALLAS